MKSKELSQPGRKEEEVEQEEGENEEKERSRREEAIGMKSKEL